MESKAAQSTGSSQHTPPATVPNETLSQRGRRPACHPANQTFWERLCELRDDAEAAGRRQARSYRRALQALRRFPLPLLSAHDVEGLQGCGKVIAGVFQDVLENSASSSSRPPPADDASWRNLSRRRWLAELRRQSASNGSKMQPLHDAAASVAPLQSASQLRRVSFAKACRRSAAARNNAPKVGSGAWSMLMVLGLQSSVNADVDMPHAEIERYVQERLRPHIQTCDSVAMSVAKRLCERELVEEVGKHRYRLTAKGIPLAKRMISKASLPASFSADIGALSSAIVSVPCVSGEIAAQPRRKSKAKVSKESDDEDDQPLNMLPLPRRLAAVPSPQRLRENCTVHAVAYASGAVNDDDSGSSAPAEIPDPHLSQFSFRPAPSPKRPALKELPSAARTPKRARTIEAVSPARAQQPIPIQDDGTVSQSDLAPLVPLPPIEAGYPSSIVARPLQHIGLASAHQPMPIQDAGAAPQDALAPLIPLPPIDVASSSSVVSRPLQQTGSMQLVLLLDHREVGAGREHAARGALLEDLSARLGVGAVESRSLPLGDVLWIWREEPTGATADAACKSEFIAGWIIERKTFHDLSSSVMDGRYDEQKLRLLEAPGLDGVIYLIEGAAPLFGVGSSTSGPAGSPQGKQGNRGFGQRLLNRALPAATLSTTASHTQFISGFHVVHAASTSHTLSLLAALHGVLRHRGPPADCSTSVSYRVFAERTRKSCHPRIFETFGRMLRMVPHCGPEAVEALIDEFPTPQLLSKALQDHSDRELLIRLKERRGGRAPVSAGALAACRELFVV